MSKKKIIFICVAVAVVIILAFIIFFVVRYYNNSSDDTTQDMYQTDTITITEYDDNFEEENIIEITKNSKIKEFKKICENISLEQDDITSQLAIRNDVKVDLNNGTFLMLQLDLEDYCYIENADLNIYLTIKMPEGLLDYVNTILQENL